MISGGTSVNAIAAGSKDANGYAVQPEKELFEVAGEISEDRQGSGSGRKCPLGEAIQ